MSDKEDLLAVSDIAAILGVSTARVKWLIQDRNRRLLEKSAPQIGRKIGKRGTWVLTKDELELIRPMARGRPKKGR